MYNIELVAYENQQKVMLVRAPHSKHNSNVLAEFQRVAVDTISKITYNAFQV